MSSPISSRVRGKTRGKQTSQRSSEEIAARKARVERNLEKKRQLEAEKLKNGEIENKALQVAIKKEMLDEGETPRKQQRLKSPTNSPEEEKQGNEGNTEVISIEDDEDDDLYTEDESKTNTDGKETPMETAPIQPLDATDKLITESIEASKALEKEIEECIEEANKPTTDGTQADKPNTAPTQPAATKQPPAKKPSYAQSIMGQAMHVGHRYELSFKVPIVGGSRGEEIKNHMDITKNLQGILLHILETGKSIDSKFKIMSWLNNAAPINRAEDIPKTKGDLLKLAFPSGLVIRKGMNYFWRFKFDHPQVNRHQFIRFWEASKKQQNQMSDPHGYITVKETPIQHHCWFEVGWLIGTSEHQVMDYNEIKLREETGESDLYLHHHNIDIKNLRKTYWMRANEKAKKATEKMFGPQYFKARAHSAPTGWQIFTKEPMNVNKLKKELSRKYGKYITNGDTKVWPTLPDGTETLFVPAMRGYANCQASRMGIMNRMDKHIDMKEAKCRADINIKSPDMTVPCLKGKTISQAILGLKCDDNGTQRPIFHSFERKWNRNEKIKEFQLCFFQTLQSKAVPMLPKLMEELVKTYGEEIKNCFLINSSSYSTEMRNELKNEMDSVFGISLYTDGDNEDPYLSGKFKISVDMSMLADQNKNVQTGTHPMAEDISLRDHSVLGNSSAGSMASIEEDPDKQWTAFAEGYGPKGRNMEEVPLPSAAPPKPPNAKNPYGKASGNPYAKSPTKPSNNNQPPATPTNSEPNHTGDKDAETSNDNGFETTGSPAMRRQMNQTRQLARSIVTPSATPPLTPILKTTGDARRDKQLYIKKITGTLSTEEAAFLFPDGNIPAPTVQGITMEKQHNEFYTDDEVNMIIEHHAQNLLVMMEQNEQNQTGNVDGPGPKQ